MSKRKKRFNKTWASQTEIGKRFGLSGIAVGKVLLAEGVKDPATGQATEAALRDGWCVSTPLKSGIPHYMWSISKVGNLLSRTTPRISRGEQLANDLVRTIKSAKRDLDAGDDKLGYLALECAFDEIPGDLKDEVSKQLHAKGYGDYAEGWLAPPVKKKAGMD